MRKGLIGIVIGVILVAVAIGSVVATLIFTEKLSSSLTVEVTFKDKQLMEDKLHFDSEKKFLENSLLISGAYAAYKNGLNGTIYKKSWDRCTGTSIDGSVYDHVCWRDHDDEKIPSKNMVVEGIAERTNETFQDYFSNLEYTEIEDITPLQMEESLNGFNFSYKITELNLSSIILNHTLIEKNVWINATIPIRYMLLYKDAKDFTENSRTRLNNKLKNSLDNVKVCNGDGQLTEIEAEEKIKEELKKIAADESNSDEKWEIHLLEMDYTNNHPQYVIGFIVNVTVRDNDLKRRVVTTDSLEKLGITFAIKDTIDFTRSVSYLCGGTQEGECLSSRPSPICSGTTCTWYTQTSESGNCENKNCYCEHTENCNCPSDQPPQTCTNSGCKNCGYDREICCQGNCASNLVCKNGHCECGGVGEPCCGGTSCDSSNLQCQSGICVSCGGIGQPCCSGNCNTGYCDFSGICRSCSNCNCIGMGPCQGPTVPSCCSCDPSEICCCFP